MVTSGAVVDTKGGFSGVDPFFSRFENYVRVQ